MDVDVNRYRGQQMLEQNVAVIHIYTGQDERCKKSYIFSIEDCNYAHLRHQVYYSKMIIIMKFNNIQKFYFSNVV